MDHARKYIDARNYTIIRFINDQYHIAIFQFNTFFIRVILLPLYKLYLWKNSCIELCVYLCEIPSLYSFLCVCVFFSTRTEEIEI